MAANENEKQTDLIYAILLGLGFFGFLGFIVSVNVWEKVIFSLFQLDYKLAAFFNYYFGWFVGYQEVNELVNFASVPKFNFWKFQFEYKVGNDYINYVYKFYAPLHNTYAISIIFLGYLIINKFKLKPVLTFQNNFAHKQRLVEAAKERLKIKNKQMVLYKHMNVLLEKKRKPAKMADNEKFLNADYYQPFIAEELRTQTTNKVNPDKKYINDSLFYSQHYINTYFKYYVEGIMDLKKVKSLAYFDKFWKDLEKKINKKNNVQDLYYFQHVFYFDGPNKEDFISFFTFKEDSLSMFNQFLKKYMQEDALELKYLSIVPKDDPYTIVVDKDDQNYSKYKELEKYIFFSPKNSDFYLNLEEVFIYFKVSAYNFYEDDKHISYFFDSEEESIRTPLNDIYPSVIDKIEEAEINSIEYFKNTLKSLENYVSKIEKITELKEIIDHYQNFKTMYGSVIYHLKNKSEKIIKKAIEDIVISHQKLEHILHAKKDIQTVVNILTNKNNKTEEVMVYIQSYYKFYHYYLSIKESLKEEPESMQITYQNNVADLKRDYIFLAEQVKSLFEEQNSKNYTEVEKNYLIVLNQKLKEFIETMIGKIKLFYKYKLEYDVENKNNIMPEIGQPVMPSCYILTPFLFNEHKSSVKSNESYFKLMEGFKVNGYKKYIYPVFSEIFNNWYGNIEQLIGFYEKEIDKNEQNLDISEEEKIETELKFSLLKREAAKQKTSNTSIETKLLNIFAIHKFEETIIIALWKEFTKLENLPTTKLSNLKYDNFILWYSLTCIGDVTGSKEAIKVIGRPFDYNAGLPITIMYETEIYEYNKKLEIKNHDLGED